MRDGAYCCLPRRKGYSDPITVFTNIEQIGRHEARHVAKQGPKVEPKQCDQSAWVYDIGENSDCLADALLSDNVRELCDLFRMLPTAKASFATEFVIRELLQWDPMGRTRIRLSLLPHETAKVMSLRTSPVAERVAAIYHLVEAGHEVHVNFSPIILSPPTWFEDWTELLLELDAALSPAAKAQLAAEVIFPTHNEALHETNLGGHPKAEELLRRPDLQKPKLSQNGQLTVRHRVNQKRMHLDVLAERVLAHFGI